MIEFIKFIFRVFLTMLFFFFVNICEAQKEETISADRPDQTEGTYILPKNNFQLSEGFLFTQKTFQNDLILRYGLFKNTEIRTSVSFGSYIGRFELNPVQFSLKNQISGGDGILPSMSFIASADFEMLASKDLQTRNVPIQAIFAFNHDIGEKYYVAYNLGGSSWFKDLLLTVESGVELNEKVSIFLEYYAQYLKGSKPDHNMDCGILFLVNPFLQIDVAAGRSIMDNKSLFFTAGFSYWFKPRKNTQQVIP